MMTLFKVPLVAKAGGRRRLLKKRLPVKQNPVQLGQNSSNSLLLGFLTVHIPSHLGAVPGCCPNLFYILEVTISIMLLH